LHKYLKANPSEKSKFTAKQLADIKAGKYKISDYTWHHNADSNNMQLIPKEVHTAIRHIGENSMSKGK